MPDKLREIILGRRAAAATCKSCQDILLRKASLHHQNIARLEQAAVTEKCFFCNTLWQQLGPAVRKITNNFIVEAGVVNGVRDKEFYLRLVDKDSNTAGRPAKAHHEAVFQLIHALSALMDEKRVPSVQWIEPGSPKPGITAMKWLKSCCENHTLCDADEGRGEWNPTRLLDLQGDDNTRISLVDHSSLTQPVIYATLSHRWGKTQSLLLTTTTEARLREGITVSKLPTTFKHAVEVARALELRYIWIDCLCIIQDGDGKADWLREAALMHKVYRYGHLNISAIRGEGEHQGLYYKRDYRANAFTMVDADVSGTSNSLCMAADVSFWSNNVDQASLNHRGWVLQERILSRRILSFGWNQLFWECRKLRACESYPERVIPALERRQEHRKAGHKPAPLGLGSLHPRSESFKASLAREDDEYTKWYDIIGAYSRCGLTFPMDKLPAITGIAKQMAETLQDTYIAGMWRKNLVSQLVWSVEEPGKAIRSAKYRAPSWSWASIDGVIRFYDVCKGEQQVAIEQISLDHASEDKFGPLLGGRLYVKGKLRRIKLDWKEGNNSGLQTGWRVRFPSGGGQPLGPHNSWISLDESHESFQAQNEAGELFLLSLQHVEKKDQAMRPPSSQDSVTPRYYSHEAMLLQADNPLLGSYSRIGVVATSYGVWYEDDPDYPCMSYDTELKRHTIYIV